MTSTLASEMHMTPRGLLDPVRGHGQAVQAAEVAQMVAAPSWAIAHEVLALEDAAVVAGFGQPDAVTLAGVGAPLVAESAVTELALAVGMSSDAGARYLGEVLEVRYRLPRLWEAVLAGSSAVWRARRIAQATAVRGAAVESERSRGVASAHGQ